MAWAKNGTPDTLTSAGDALTISDLTATKFNVILNHGYDDGGASGITYAATIDNITTSTYAERTSENGAADTTSTSRTNISLQPAFNPNDQLNVIYSINIATEEKLFIAFDVDTRSGTGAATAPNRREIVSKQSGTSTAYTRIDVTDTGGAAAKFDTDSNLSALGTD